MKHEHNFNWLIGNVGSNKKPFAFENGRWEFENKCQCGLSKHNEIIYEDKEDNPKNW